jgi:hypothetical protein
MDKPPLQLVAEQGKDWGLSVVGTREQLLDLAASLQRAVEAEPESMDRRSPVQVLEAAVLSPYIDRPHFYLVYCMAASSGARSTATSQVRSGPSGAVLLGVAALCIVGVVAIAGWVLHAL